MLLPTTVLEYYNLNVRPFIELKESENHHVPTNSENAMDSGDDACMSVVSDSENQEVSYDPGYQEVEPDTLNGIMNYSENQEVSYEPGYQEVDPDTSNNIVNYVVDEKGFLVAESSSCEKQNILLDTLLEVSYIIICSY